MCRARRSAVRAGMPAIRAVARPLATSRRSGEWPPHVQLDFSSWSKAGGVNAGLRKARDLERREWSWTRQRPPDHRRPVSRHIGERPASRAREEAE